MTDIDVYDCDTDVSVGDSADSLVICTFDILNIHL